MSESSDFKKDLKNGQKFEQVVADILGVPLGSQHRDHGDMLFDTSVGETNIEVKQDALSDKTKNLCIEMADISKGETFLTGFFKNCFNGLPTVYVHGLGEDPTHVILYDPTDILAWVQEDWRPFFKLQHWSNGWGKTVGGLIKIESFLEKSTGGQLIGEKVALEDLKYELEGWQPVTKYGYSTDELMDAYEIVLECYGSIDDENFITDKLLIKGQ